MKNLKKTILALAAVAITIGYLWQANQGEAPKQSTWEDVQAEAASGGYHLVTTEELADVYDKDPSKILIVDTRQEWEYRTGHIKGAVNFPMEPTWWQRWRKAGDLEELLGADKDRMVVFY